MRWHVRLWCRICPELVPISWTRVSLVPAYNDAPSHWSGNLARICHAHTGGHDDSARQPHRSVRGPQPSEAWGDLQGVFECDAVLINAGRPIDLEFDVVDLRSGFQHSEDVEVSRFESAFLKSGGFYSGRVCDCV